MSVSEAFWNATLEELKRGYRLEGDHYVCLLCGNEVETGIVYPADGLLYEAERYMRRHIDNVHHSVFDYLTQLDKKLTGLTEHQTLLLRLFYQGKSDAEIQQELGIGSASTIRNHRFVLKEKERQSRVFLAVMELLKERDKHAPATLGTAKKESIAATPSPDEQDERTKILRKYFPEGTSGPLYSLPRKEKHKLVVLQEATKRFESGRTYDEKEVNHILQDVYHDYVLLRRNLIDHSLLEREPDGSQYWLKTNEAGKAGEQMDRKKELKLQYKEMKTEAGVYQIKNTKNQKVLVDSTMNLKTINGKKFQLQNGSHINKALQKEWNEYGEEAFVFEVLEVLKVKEDAFWNAADELAKLEEKWLDKLKPYGDKGYNSQPNK
ncbi:DUF2087 domain-containing protein [Brevibacillus sp. B_LB10_24]|uniref:DUF2087 domain-containing protein n=1 Tax=Brevibacillus sp. B_LB10_24 TaxID=3380645 RepID=UPI0038BC0A1E